MRKVGLGKVGVPVLLAIVLVACSGGDDDDNGATGSSRATTTSSSTTTTVAPTTTGAPSTTAPTTGTTVPCPVPAFGSIAPQTSPLPSGTMVLTTVKVTTKGCTDDVRFDFESDASEAPGYRVDYQPGPFTQDGSGAPVPVAGGAFLVVRFEPATGFDFVNNRESYTGPDRIPVTGGAFTTEVVRTGDFEGVISWVIGVREQVPFTVERRGAPAHHVTIHLGDG